VEDLFHFELARGLQVGPAPPRFGEDLGPLVRELAYRLGSAGVDT
jgi:hypothetical protein